MQNWLGRFLAIACLGSASALLSWQLVVSSASEALAEEPVSPQGPGKPPLSAIAPGFSKGSTAYYRRNYAVALTELRPLAEAGHAKSQYIIGEMYRHGRGLRKDYTEAGKWLHAAAEQGDVKAQLSLGLMCWRGQGVPRDMVRAYMWMHLAAENGYNVALNAQSLLARRLTSARLHEGQVLANDWRRKHMRK